MPYLNVDLDYFDHPKTLKIIGILGPGAAELPLRLWAYCGKFKAKDGLLEGYSDGELEAVIRWWGDAGKAIKALLLVGYLERVDNSVDKSMAGFKIHDWKAHQGHIWALKTRNKKVASNRWKNIARTPKFNAKNAFTVDTSGIPETNPGIPQSNPGVPLSVLSFPSNPSKGSLGKSSAQALPNGEKKPKLCAWCKKATASVKSWGGEICANCAQMEQLDQEQREVEI